jgi:hypothetical protein
MCLRLEVVSRDRLYGVDVWRHVKAATGAAARVLPARPLLPCRTTVLNGESEELLSKVCCTRT